MANKIKYNLKNVHAAKLTLSDSGEYTYDTPKAIPGAVSISLDAEVNQIRFMQMELFTSVLHQITDIVVI